jgi:hypothetical protein
MDIYSEKIRNKANTSQFIVLIAGLLFTFVPLFTDGNSTRFLVSVFGLFFLVSGLLYWLNIIFGYKLIGVNNNHLIIQSHLFIRYKTLYYNLAKIKKPKVIYNDKADSYSGVPTQNIFGHSHIPEDMRDYDINPVIITFKYGKRDIKIGKDLKPFNGKKIVDTIKKTNKENR